jgi:hypothetical protein
VQAHILSPFPDWSRWLTPLVVGVCLVAAVLLAAARLRLRLRLPLLVGAVAVAVCSLLAAPAAWATNTVRNASGGGLIPHAGPAAGTGRGGFAGFAGFAGGAGGGGRGRDGSAVNTKLLQFLETHQGKTTFLMAVLNATSAAPYIIQTGKPVMAMGGFIGADPILTSTKLASLVKNGTVRYFLMSGGRGDGFTPPASALAQLPAATREQLEARLGRFGGGAGRGGFGGRGGLDSGVSRWITTKCTAVPASQWQSSTGAIGAGAPGSGVPNGGNQSGGGFPRGSRSGAGTPGGGFGGFGGFGANQLYDCGSAA